MSDANQVGKIGWVDISVDHAARLANGGKVIVEPRGLAGGQFCVIEDPNGIAAALYQP